MPTEIYELDDLPCPVEGCGQTLLLERFTQRVFGGQTIQKMRVYCGRNSEHVPWNYGMQEGTQHTTTI